MNQNENQNGGYVRPFDMVLQAARDCREAGRDWARRRREVLHSSVQAMANAPAWPVGEMLDEAERRVPRPAYSVWDADERTMLAREVDRAAAERWEELRREADNFLSGFRVGLREKHP